MQKIELKLNDTQLLKGFGILCIVLHNFCHWLPKCALENEYTFHLKRTFVLLDFLKNGEHIFLNLFSYFGHYGVPLFLFLSGYGLVRKYEQQPHSPSSTALSFIWHQACKLWHLLWPGLLLWFFSDLYLHDWHWTHTWQHVVLLVGFVGNFLVGQDIAVGPEWLRHFVNSLPKRDLLMGPWWFFSLIMQLYIVYRLLLYRRGKLPLILITTGCLALLTFSVLIHDRHQDLLCFLRYNFVGSFLPFAMGIWAARYALYVDQKLSLLALCLFVVSCFHSVAWLFSPLLFVIACLPMVSAKGAVRLVLEEIGRLSAILFVVHPIVRAYFMLYINQGGHWYAGLFGYLLITFALALVYRHVLTHTDRQWRRFHPTTPF